MKLLSVQNKNIPALGFGTWKLAGHSCVDAVSHALDIGYRHIDTAQIYQNETEVGQALRKSAVPRGELFVTTKIWRDDVAPERMAASVDRSLERLGLDRVDLLLIHWPVETIPMREQMEALSAVRAAGKTGMIGVSNFTVAQMREAGEDCAAGIACNQVEYHPMISQRPVLDYIQERDMFLTAYSPIGRGKALENPTIRDIASRYCKTPAQIALRWLMEQECVAAIPKSADPDRARSNFEIFDFTLEDADMKAICALARDDGRMVNPEWAPQWDSAKAA